MAMARDAGGMGEVPEFSKFAKRKNLASVGASRGEELPPIGSLDALLKDEKTEVTQSTEQIQEK